MMSSLFRASLMPFAFFLAGCVGLYDDVSSMVDRSRCNLRVGILSDTHLAPPRSDKMFEKALRYFREREVDAVVIAGDVTQSGALAQWRGVMNVWNKVFAQSHVVPIVVTGEKDGPKVFEGLMGEKFATVFSRTIKGYAFIGANWKDAVGVDARALKPLLAQVDGTKPFFYVQNLIPSQTCCPNEGRLDVYEGGKIAYMLSKHPNAVAICGRSHTPLTDESAFWHDRFTCVNAGSFSFATLRDEKDGVRKNVHHGLVMSVYDSSIVFERFDFGCELKQKRQRTGVYVEKLGRDWILPLPAKGNVRPETDAPQFWEDTRLMILPSAKVVSVRFPPILAKHTGVRAYAYDVRWSARGEKGARMAYSPACCASEERETQAVSCDFPRKDLPTGSVRFEVTPLDAFGKRGRTIAGEVTL